MKYFLKKLIAFAIVWIFVFQAAVPALAANNTAVTIKLLKVEGSNIKITNASKKSIRVKEGMRIYNGYTIETKKKSYVYLTLDDSKAVKLDQNTKVKIIKKGSKNEISLSNGELFFNVSKKLKSNEKMTVKTSNISMGIRGTSGTMGIRPEINEQGEITGMTDFIQMYDGAGDISYQEAGSTNISSVQLPAGEKIQADQNRSVKTSRLEVTDMPSFAIKEILTDDSLYERFVTDTGIDKDVLNENLKAIEEAEATQDSILEGFISSKQKELTSEKSTSYNTSPTIKPEGGSNTDNENSGNTDTGAETPTTPETPEEKPEKPEKPSTGDPGDTSGSNKKETTIQATGKLKISTLKSALNKYETVYLTGIDIIISDDFTVPIGRTLVITAESTVLNDGEIEINGTLINYSSDGFKNTDEIEVNLLGKFVNEGLFVNADETEVYGMFSNKTTGVVRNLKGGEFKVRGIIENNGSFENQGSYTCTGLSYGNPIKEFYNVTFLNWDGSQLGDIQEVEAGTKAYAPDYLLSSGTTFTGWDKDFSKVTGDMIIKPTTGMDTTCTIDGDVNIGLSFNDALNFANNANDTNVVVTLNHDIQSVNKVEFTGDDVVLDLNTFEASIPELVNSGGLKIKNGLLELTPLDTQQYGVYNTKELTLEGVEVTVNITNTGTYAFEAIKSNGSYLLQDNTSVSVNGVDNPNNQLTGVAVMKGEFRTRGSNSRINMVVGSTNIDTMITAAVHLSNMTAYYLDEGLIKGQNYGVLLSDNSTFYMNGGSIENEVTYAPNTVEVAVIKSETGSANVFVANGVIHVENQYEYGIKANGGNVAMSSGSLELNADNTYGIYNVSDTAKKGEVTMSQGAITYMQPSLGNEVIGIAVDGVFTLSEGNIRLKGMDTKGVVLEDGAKAVIKGGLITVEQSSATGSYCIYADDGKSASLELIGGTLNQYYSLIAYYGSGLIVNGNGTTLNVDLH